MVTPTRRSLWKWLASRGGEQSFYMGTVNSEWPVTPTVFLETFSPSQPRARAKAVTYLCLFSYSGEELSRLSDVLCTVPGVPVCFAVSPLELYFDKLYWAEKRVFLWVCVSCTLIGVREQQEQDCCTRGAKAGAEGGPGTDSLTGAPLAGSEQQSWVLVTGSSSCPWPGEQGTWSLKRVPSGVKGSRGRIQSKAVM